MRKIVHISDTHFGMVDGDVVESLIKRINELGPDLVVLSGDLTQRARSAQFAAARDFLDRLPGPKIVVPGNHDVPLYNVMKRFGSPLAKYKQYITEDLAPFFADEEIAVAGINTARSLTIKGGRINAEQVAEICARMGRLPESVLKIVVTHHPFDVPDGEDERDIVERAEKALPLFVESGADVFLSGHLHVSRIGQSARRYKLDNGYSALIIQAGTATSTRGRGEPNSFNLLEYDSPMLTVKRFQCVIPSDGFRLTTAERFAHGPQGWARG